MRKLEAEVTKLSYDKARRHYYKTTVKKSFSLSLCYLTVSVDHKIKPKSLNLAFKGHSKHPMLAPTLIKPPWWFAS